MIVNCQGVVFNKSYDGISNKPALSVFLSRFVFSKCCPFLGFFSFSALGHDTNVLKDIGSCVHIV